MQELKSVFGHMDDGQLDLEVEIDYHLDCAAMLWVEH